MSSLLNIGLSGVSAAQSQLVTTSHNIANVDVAGYHRQRVIQTTHDPMFTGAGFFGNGTRIAAVSRAYDQFLEKQVLSASTRKSEYSTYATQIRQIDNMLADPTAGLSPAMDDFFAGVQEVAANPTSAAARQALLSNAQALVTRFQGLDARLAEIREGVEYEINSTVEQINTYAKAIAEMNQRIIVAQAAGSGLPANDLLDQRGQLVSELNELVKVTTQVQDDGSLSVFIGSGQNLVIGNTPTTLATVANQNDPQRSDIAIIPDTPPHTPIVLPERVLNGGQLAGLLNFRSESLDATQNRLGLIAATVVTAFNNQHKLGVDLDGALGLDFFTLPAPKQIPVDALASVKIDPENFGQLTDSDYLLSFDGVTTYTLTNRDTGTSTTFGSNATVSFEGLTITSPPTPTLAAGETALIQPTRHMARDLAVAVTDPRKVAAGNPVISETPNTNMGTAKVSNIVMNDVNGVLSAWDVTLTYDATQGKFTVDPAADFTIAPDALFDPASNSAGKTFTLKHNTSGFKFTFTVAGVPADKDVLNLMPTEKGIADSRNANLLGALQTARMMLDGTTTLGGAYSQLVNKVGNKTHEVLANEAAQTTLLTQATDTRNALSAVNLDEEAANLVRYQQAYQASGKVMSIAQSLFDELLSIVR
ncbi:MAG: flagellar hook-associated protein FlgK [Azoarcus sp.]|nr:flagellar hook-associated protein FlgK [Azoarcus sp.]